MKVSDYIVTVLESKDVNTVFGLSGGMIAHLLDSFYRRWRIHLLSMHHQPGTVSAADAFGRMTSIPGVPVAASGPGATNLMTALSDQCEGVLNLDSGRARPLQDIAETIRDLARADAPLGIGKLPYRRDQVMPLETNIDRLRQSIGWMPQTSLAEGLRRTAAYCCQPRKPIKTA